jgi:hypothetical protein
LVLRLWEVWITGGQVRIRRCSRGIGDYTPERKTGKQSGLGEALVMGSRAARLVALIILFADFGGPSSGAMGLCDCCGAAAALTPDCRSACETAREEIPMCRPVVLYHGDVGERPGANALATGSLKYLSMGRPDRPSLERFRQWLELWRSRAEAKFQATLARCENGEGSHAAFASAEAERDQALVNYQHGMQRYMDILRDGRRKRVATVLARAQSARPAGAAGGCMSNSVKAPCAVAEATSAAMPREVVPRREAHRGKRVAWQKIAQQKVAQQTLVRMAVRIATACTGNWVNAACAAP